MAGYSLLVKKSAVKELETVEPRSIRAKIVSRIRSLAENPRPEGSQKLTGEAERYRIRQGAYRILYSVDDSTCTVEIVKIGHRSDVYR